ncbi:MAG: cellulase family glycosylhydrolase [Acidimicrobiales bacterium]
MTVVSSAFARAAVVALLVALATPGLSLVGGIAPAGASPEAGAAAGFAVPPVVGHAGRWLLDAKGRVVLLDGVNMVAKSSATPAGEGFDAADAAWLEKNGIDVVRLGFTAAAVMPTPGHIDRAWLRSYVRTLDQLTSHGLLVLVDLHQDGWGPTVGSDGFPGWMTLTGGATNNHVGFPGYYTSDPAVQAAFQSFWNGADGPGGVSLEQRAADVLGALASSVASDRRVLGYDMLNEPWPGTTWQPCLSNPDGCPALDRLGLDRYYATAVAAIRAHDPRHLVFAEPYVLFNFGLSTTHVRLPPGEKDGGLSFHMYTASPADEPAVLDHAVAWSHSSGGALLETEFGATTETASIDRMIGEADRALVPWIFWAFDQDVVHSLALPPSGSNLVSSTVAAIVRPHPVAVAGTPTSSSYDPATRTMRCTWSTKGPGGRRYPAATPTLFNVPMSLYPAGYRVRVVGGRVVGSRHQALTVEAARGASSVSVTVSPAG